MVTAFNKIKETFGANWTTVLVGWRGLGVLSPWPDRWIEFPPLLSFNEIADYAEERLSSSCSPSQEGPIHKILSFDRGREQREQVENVLNELSRGDDGDQVIELRKWRLILLEQLLEHFPADAVNGLLSLSEFWQSFGFPDDSPHEIQGRRSSVGPSEYYRDDNFRRLVALHHQWIATEKAAVNNSSTKRARRTVDRSNN